MCVWGPKSSGSDTGLSRNDATDNIHDEYIRLTLIRVCYCSVGGAAESARACVNATAKRGDREREPG